MPLLEIQNLSVEFPSRSGTLRAVDGVSVTLDKGEVLGIVGESGSGKSVGMLAVMGLVPFPGRVTADRLRFEGRDLLSVSDRERRALTGKDVAMIFQEPTTSLNPSFTIGFQLAETLRVHEGMDRKAARRRVIELLEQVGIPAAESRLSAYPHQLSGGMNQRVMIAMAIACNPKLLIADHRARRHHPGADPRPAAVAAARPRHGADPDHAQHGRGVGHDPARRRDVCGADHGAARDRKPVRRAAAPVHGGAARGAPGGERRRPPRHHSGRGAGTI
jgi:ABC-type dipeptide/oligopeptide/nickel transport system ATPase subunit